MILPVDVLIEIMRQGDAALARIERRHAKIAQRAWDRVWPSAKAEILASITGEITDEATLLAAIDRAGRLFGGDDYLTDRDEREAVTVAADAYALGHVEALEQARKAGRVVRWRRSVARAVDPEDVEEIFQAPMTPAMTIVDQRAAAWLARDTIFWIREAWDQRLGAEIAGTAKRNLVDTGGRTKELAKEMKAQLGAKFDKPDHYWDVVANASLQRARSMGNISGFELGGASKIIFLAVNDQRTSNICRDVHGTVWTIGQVQRHRASILATGDPDELKEVAPWAREKDIVGKNADELAALGVMTPPLHGRCRSTLAVEEWAPLGGGA